MLHTVLWYTGENGLGVGPLAVDEAEFAQLRGVRQQFGPMILVYLPLFVARTNKVATETQRTQMYTAYVGHGLNVVAAFGQHTPERKCVEQRWILYFVTGLFDDAQLGDVTLK